MKRSEHLEPLSHDHYESLLVASRIAKGRRADVSAAVMADYVRHFWKDHLSDHFAQEEEHLLPLIEASAQADLGRRMVDEHEEIRRAIEGLSAESSGEMLDELTKLMKGHIRFEERELFPMLESEAAPDALRSAGTALHAAHREADLDWNPPFWDQ